ncbi:cyclopropane-fatty-acyl-phospholipid synthase family protein, partial [Rickettsiales bacterium]|nr:cyclopropane-fatty-acyl-phospholipid synthase family protein [Rickettsiales bacterium]
MEQKILKYLEKVKNGYLEITTPQQNKIEIGNKNSQIKADINIKNWDLVDLVLSKGDIGFGKAYMDDIFTTTSLDNLLSFITANQQELEPLFHSNILYSAFFQIKNLFKKNSIKGSKKNIEYHYDLGNDFYQLWLDDTMSYSSGIFDEKSCLIQSQKNKYQRILNNLNKNGSDILEIGCGWGGFIHEASRKGYYVKGLTLSNEQKLYADNLIKNKNLNAKIHIQDYRLEKEKFDNIVSIEMFEAVGKDYWNDYFAKIKECLKKDGRAMVQTIVIDDKYYDKYLKTSDYIREYIFPGGFLPSPNIFKKLANDHNLQVIDEFQFSDSYNKTLLQWLDNFNNKKQEILKLGYSEKFFKKWQFYLAYCAAGFSSKRTNIIQ